MEILALLAAEDSRRFRLALPRHVQVREVSIAALETHMESAAPKLVVIDPALVRPDRFVSLVQQFRSLGNVAVLVYAALTPDTAHAVIVASGVVPVETVFFGSYDERGALAAVCEQLLVTSVPAIILSHLARSIGRMPLPLSTRVVGMFGGQPIAASTSGMLEGLGVSVHAARDWLRSAGIEKPHALRASIVLARLYPELSQNHERLESIAERHGVRSVRVLARACQMLTGLSARRAGRLSPVEFASRIVTALRGSRQ
jgi:hypothetical protein